RSSANAAHGGLEPPAVERFRRAYLHLSHSTASRSLAYMTRPLSTFVAHQDSRQGVIILERPERVLTSQGRRSVLGFGRGSYAHSPEQRLWPVRWQLNLRSPSFAISIVVLRHHINCDAPKARISVPIVTNGQVKRSGPWAWYAPCPEPWTCERRPARPTPAQ